MAARDDETSGVSGTIISSLKAFSASTWSHNWWKCLTRSKEVSNNSKVDTDLISELADDILHCIILRLATRDVAILSLVSKRWRQLCKGKFKVEFDWYVMFDMRTYGAYLSESKHHCPEHKNRFIRGVYQHLKFNTNLELSYLRVSFCLGESSMDIDRWVRFATNRGVSILILHLSCVKSTTTIGGTYIFRPQLFPEGNVPKMTILSLRNCVLGHDLFAKLPALKILRLYNLIIEEQQVKSILSCCLNLEEIMIWRCILPSKLSIRGSVLHLKKLKVRDCENLQEIELLAAFLTFFEYWGRDIDFSFQEVPRLKSMFIRAYDGSEVSIFSNLTKSFPPLKALTVDAATCWVHFVPMDVSRFSNIKQLTIFSFGVMDFDILKLTSILRICQHLESLRISTEFCRGPMDLPFEYVHSSLKKVELGGFYRIWEQIEFVKYLLECAVALEEIIIDHRVEIYDGIWWIVAKREEWSTNERDKVRDLLQDFLRTASLIVR